VAALLDLLSAAAQETQQPFSRSRSLKRCWQVQDTATVLPTAHNAVAANEGINGTAISIFRTFGAFTAIWIAEASTSRGA